MLWMDKYLRRILPLLFALFFPEQFNISKLAKSLKHLAHAPHSMTCNHYDTRAEPFTRNTSSLRKEVISKLLTHSVFFVNTAPGTGQGYVTPKCWFASRKRRKTKTRFKKWLTHTIKWAISLRTEQVYLLSNLVQRVNSYAGLNHGACKNTFYWNFEKPQKILTQNSKRVAVSQHVVGWCTVCRTLFGVYQKWMWGWSQRLLLWAGPTEKSLGWNCSFAKWNIHIKRN